MSRRSSSAAIALVGALALAGCGSTVQLGSTGTTATGQVAGADDGSGLGGLDGLGIPTTAPTDTPSPPGAPTTDGQPSSAPSESSAPTSSATSGSTSAPTSSASAAAAIRGPGVTATTITIGYTTSRDLSGVAGSLGIAGANPGDIDAQVKTVVDQINARGGLAGRKIVLISHDFKALAQNKEAEAQAACADFTQDHKVFAVIDSVRAGIKLAPCLNKANVPLITNDYVLESALKASPLATIASFMSIDAYYPALVKRLVAMGYFSKWDALNGKPGSAPVKVAMQSFDTPDDVASTLILKKAIEAAGYPVVEVEQHSTNIADNASSTQAAVLRFKSKGVTHVLNANVLFYQGAQSQGYHPRYGVDDTITTVALLAENVGKNQLHGAMGTGFLPLDEQAGLSSVNKTTDACLAAMRKNGQDTSAQFTRTVMTGICDMLGVLEAAVRKSGLPTPQGFRAGLEALGSSVPTALTYGLTFGPGRHFGASKVRDFVYTDACSCFKLTGPIHSA